MSLLRRWAPLLLAALTAHAAAPAQADELEAAPGSVFVLLIGYPDAPPGRDLPTLNAVEDDVLNMEAFFRVLEPRQVILHLPKTPSLQARRPGADLRAPTMPAIRASVADLVASLARAPTPRRVYVYYAGHGERHRARGYVHTRLYLARTGGSQPGDDGVLDARLLADEILTPLGRHASVHFIADACQSYFLLETRAVERRRRVFKRHPRAAPSMVGEFVSRHPRVGALLATNGSQSTYEDPALGGLFSHALRSAGIGQADFDQDGVVNYREMELAMTWILAGRAGAGAPGVVGPGGDGDAPFIDYRGVAAAAQVRFTPEVAGRYEVLTDEWAPFVTIHGGRRPIAAFFEMGRAFRAIGRAAPAAPPQWWRYVAGHGDFAVLRTPLTRALQRRGDRFEGLFPRPLGELNADLMAPASAAPQWQPRGYLGVAALGTADAYPAATPPGVSFAPGAALSLRMGRGASHLFADALWSRWSGRFTNTGQCYTADLFRGRLGYGRTLIDDRFEAALGPALGAGGVVQSDCQGAHNVGTTFEATGALTVHLPVPDSAPAALRLDLRGGVQAVPTTNGDLAIYPLIGMAAGIEWESVLE